MLVVKDFTAMLTMPHDARAEILGTLRDAYDGEACKVFGNGERRAYRSRFGMLAAVTPVIDKKWGVSAQLGERFLRFRLVENGRLAKVRSALGNSNDEVKMRRELSEVAQAVLAQSPVIATIASDIESRIMHLAEFIALARSEVSRDRKGIVDYLPSPEVGCRVAKSLKKLSQGIAMAFGVEVVDDIIFRIICRVALGTIPSMRLRLLTVLWQLRGTSEPSARIAGKAMLDTKTATGRLADLWLLDIVKRSGNPRAGYRWWIADEFTATIKAANLDFGAARVGDKVTRTEAHSTRDDSNQSDGAPIMSLAVDTDRQDSND